jgi:hypothetical protein
VRGIYLALLDQRQHQRADEGLGGREHLVLRARSLAVEVALVDDAALVHHEHRIRVRLLDQLVEADHPAFAHGPRDLAEIERHGFQLRCRLIATRDLARRLQLADVLEGPAVGGRSHEVAPPDDLVRRRRKALHQSELRRARVGRRMCGRCRHAEQQCCAAQQGRQRRSWLTGVHQR